VKVIMNASDGKPVDTTPMLNNGTCSPLPSAAPVATPPTSPSWLPTRGSALRA